MPTVPHKKNKHCLQIIIVSCKLDQYGWFYDFFLVADVVTCSMWLIKLLLTVNTRKFHPWLQPWESSIIQYYRFWLILNSSLECPVNISCEHSRKTSAGSTRLYVLLETPRAWDQPWLELLHIREWTQRNARNKTFIFMTCICYNILHYIILSLWNLDECQAC